MGLREARAGRRLESTWRGSRVYIRFIQGDPVGGIQSLRVATGAEVEATAAAVLRVERTVAGFGVVSKGAMRREVGSVLDQLAGARQQRPGQHKHERSDH